jgi:hypothetical protein
MDPLHREREKFIADDVPVKHLPRNFRGAAARIIVIMLLCTMIICACSKRSVREEGVRGPGAAVASVITLADQGRYDEAAMMVDFRKVASLDADFNDSEGGGWSEDRKIRFWELLTLNRRVSKVRILSEKVRGDFAVVVVEVIDLSGGEQRHSFDLEKKASGGWIVIVYYKMVR